MSPLARLLPVSFVVACLHAAPETSARSALPAPDTLTVLTCRPNPVVRGQWLVCRMNDARYSVTRWHFRADPDTVNPPLPDVENISSSWEWAGPVVVGGLVTVLVVDSTGRGHAFQEHVTVTPRQSCWACTWSYTGGSTVPTPPAPPSDTARASDDSVLAQHGHLKLRSYSIHGAAPLILIMTDAPAWAGAMERWYRRTFTKMLTRSIEMRGFSYYAFRDPGGSDSPFSTPQQMLERLETAAGDVAASLRNRQLPPAAYIGLAEGAVVAARVAMQDPLPARLAALAPSLPGRGGKGLPRWVEVIQALDNRLPVLLAMQSACDGPMPDALIQAAGWRQRLLLLPDFDSWLGMMQGTVCSPERRVPGRVPGLSVAQMVAEWLGASVVFPE